MKGRKGGEEGIRRQTGKATMKNAARGNAERRIGYFTHKSGNVFSILRRAAARECNELPFGGIYVVSRRRARLAIFNFLSAGNGCARKKNANSRFHSRKIFAPKMYYVSAAAFSKPQ